ncbi:MAG TPA: ThiF family adenylyltransferase [Gemmataceae bacterium]|nr:ThiF family adenylyltransferase [Gemmataceae bacterium]
MTDADWQRLRDQFKVSFRSGRCPETGAIGILGENQASDRREFILTKLLLPEPGDVKIAAHDHLVFNSSYIRRAHLEMRAQRLAGLVFIHTHPMADTHVSFSMYDDREEPLLVENLQELEPSTRVVSVVFGKASQRGRLWVNPTRSEDLGRLIIIGEAISHRLLNGRPEPPAPAPAAIFDRGRALTSAGALGILSGLTVAVIGASGTGSLICELLARAGCRHILLIDDDVIKVINLNRVLYATQLDVERKTPKVEVIRRGIETLGLGCRVEPVMGNILDRDILVRLREADIMIGCVDRGFPRHVLCEFAYRYCRPFIDVGSEIGGDEKGIVSVDARTSYVAPGRPCLQCAGIVTSRQLHFESLCAAERERVLRLGYSDDLVIEQPAVMDLNMRPASFGMIVLRHLLQPFLLTPLPIMMLENMVTYAMRAVREPRVLDPNCSICQTNRRAGYGDCGPPLGLEKDALLAIIGENQA